MKESAVKKRISKADLLLISLLLFIGAAGFLAVRLFVNQNGADVRVMVDGAEYGAYDLSRAQTVPIKQGGITTNTLEIADGQAKMIQADCPDRLCMHQKAVSRQGEMIVCLPNKVTVEVIGNKQAPLDAVAQ